MRRLALAAALVALCAAALAPAASAHGGNAQYRSVVRDVRPPLDGLEVEVLNYDAELEVVVPSGHEAVLFGYEDEPYARVLRDGTVQVNERSPATYLNEDRYATTEVPAAADPEAPPRWRTVGGSGRFVFHDHRMHYMAEGTPPAVVDESRRAKVFDYDIPIRLDGGDGAIEGTLYWVGDQDTSKAPFLIAGAAIVLLGGAAALVARRRRGGAGGGDARGDGGGEAW